MSRRVLSDAPDAVWSVTGRVNWRVWHLQEEWAYQTLLRLLEQVLRRFGMDLIAFVVMSNHFHLVLRCPSELLFRELTRRRTKCRHYRPWPPGHFKSTVIAQCMHWLTLTASKSIQEELGLTGHFWQGKHFRRRILDGWSLIVAVAYDHRNPVRKAMAARPELYERSSAGWWALCSESPVPLAVRSDFPFDMERDSFRERLLVFQGEKRLDDVFEAFDQSGLRMDSAAGRQHLEHLMREAGLDPLGCGIRAAP